MGKKRFWILGMAVILAVSLLTGCGSDHESITSVDQLNDPSHVIGVATNTTEDQVVMQELPDARIEYMKDTITAYTAVSQGKLDAFVFGKREMEIAVENGQKGVKILDVTLGEGNRAAVGVSPKTKIPDLLEKVNTFIAESKADGSLDDLNTRWVMKEDDTMPDIPVPEKSDIHLVVGTVGTAMPYTYYKGTMLTGRDIELARRFAAWLGAELEFKIYDYDGVVAAAQSGDVDCIMANLYITPERAEVIPFSDPYWIVEIGVMVRDTGSTEKQITEYADLSGKTVSMLTGAPFEDLVLSKAPDVGEFTFFNNMPDMLLALKEKKTDAVLINNAIAELAVNRDPETKLFLQPLQEGVFGFAFAKGDESRQKWQKACDSISEETRNAVWEKWTGADESVKILPEQDWPGSNGTVTVAACDSLEPMSYAGEGGIQGFDIEMLLLMAKELDVHLQINGMEFSAVMAAVQSGKAQIGAGSIIVTEERKQAVDFVDYFPSQFVLIVRNAQETKGAGAGFLTSLKNSLDKTFIKENRWKLFLQGIGCTLMITGLAIILGTVLGFCVYMVCRKGNRAANAITRFCIWLVQGMPAVVLLMILYYIIFARMNISGAAVSVIGFSLLFGAAVFAMLKASVGTIDRGQMEAAYALGYTDRRAFFQVVLPQALPHFMPAYKGEITALIKATAIVGYVAAQDLTKVGDLIRSRTYDAFFPLITVAVFYFILAGILTWIVNRIEIRVDPRHRKPEDILKGVKVR